MSSEDPPLLHQLFEAQAERTPDDVAVICGDVELTYRELNRQANRLAHHLQELGVGPEVLVALCMQRTVYAVVGVLAVLKAGGAYIPLDPSHPPERLSVLHHLVEVLLIAGVGEVAAHRLQSTCIQLRGLSVLATCGGSIPPTFSLP